VSGGARAAQAQRAGNEIGDPARELLSGFASHAVMADFQARRIARALDNTCALAVRAC